MVLVPLARHLLQTTISHSLDRHLLQNNGDSRALACHLWQNTSDAHALPASYRKIPMTFCVFGRHLLQNTNGSRAP